MTTLTATVCADPECRNELSYFNARGEYCMDHWDAKARQLFDHLVAVERQFMGGTVSALLLKHALSAYTRHIRAGAVDPVYMFTATSNHPMQ